ncbi:MAG: ATP-binding protein, partial [Nitrospirales bacterium]|nr:ATP-binding protein [Nitrospirales bacterium]
MGAIIYGIERRKGFVAIYGEVGVGKTTIIRAYLEKTSDRKQKTVYILNPVLSFHGLLTDIFRSLDLVPSNDDSAEMVNQLQEALIQEYRSDSTVVLVIDEAQNMP